MQTDILEWVKRIKEANKEKAAAKEAAEAAAPPATQRTRSKRTISDDDLSSSASGDADRAADRLEFTADTKPATDAAAERRKHMRKEFRNEDIHPDLAVFMSEFAITPADAIVEARVVKRELDMDDIIPGQWMYNQEAAEAEQQAAAAPPKKKRKVVGSDDEDGDTKAADADPAQADERAASSAASGSESGSASGSESDSADSESGSESDSASSESGSESGSESSSESGSESGSSDSGSDSSDEDDEPAPVLPHITYGTCITRAPPAAARYDALALLATLRAKHSHQTRMADQFKAYLRTRSIVYVIDYMNLLKSAIRRLAHGKRRELADIPYFADRYVSVLDTYRKGGFIWFVPFSDDAFKQSIADHAAKRRLALTDGNPDARDLAIKQLCYICQAYVSYPVATLKHDTHDGQACATCFRKLALVNCVRHAIRILADVPVAQIPVAAGAIRDLIAEAESWFVAIDNAASYKRGMALKADSVGNIEPFRAVWHLRAMQ